MNSNKPIVYVCSPLKGDIENNIKKAKEYCRWIMLNDNAIAFAPHIYFTQFLNDNDEFERTLGINSGLDIMKYCNKMYVFCDGGTQQNPIGLTSGMLDEIYTANNIYGIYIVYINKNTMKELINGKQI